MNCAGGQPVSSDPIGPDRLRQLVSHRLGGTGGRGGAAAGRHLGYAVAYAGRPGLRRKPRPRDLLGADHRSLSLSLDAHLIGVDRLYALCVGSDISPVEAKDTPVLLDADEASWSSWNRYAEQFAGDTGARIVRVDDGESPAQRFSSMSAACAGPC